MSEIRYEQAHDGEWVRPKHRGFRHSCCDCGLVHHVDFRVRDGQVEMRFYRLPKPTAGRRNRMKKNGEGIFNGRSKR
jgi:hypothetical protein